MHIHIKRWYKHPMSSHPSPQTTNQPFQVSQRWERAWPALHPRGPEGVDVFNLSEEAVHVAPKLALDEENVRNVLLESLGGPGKPWGKWDMGKIYNLYRIYIWTILQLQWLIIPEMVDEKIDVGNPWETPLMVITRLSCRFFIWIQWARGRRLYRPLIWRTSEPCQASITWQQNQPSRLRKWYYSELCCLCCRLRELYSCYCCLLLLLFRWWLTNQHDQPMQIHRR